MRKIILITIAVVAALGFTVWLANAAVISDDAEVAAENSEYYNYYAEQFATEDQRLQEVEEAEEREAAEQEYLDSLETPEPEPEDYDPYDLSAGGDEAVADVAYDTLVMDLLGVPGASMKSVALQICDDISDTSSVGFSVYANAFIDEASRGMDVPANDVAEFMGLSIGAYCPESSYLIESLS